MKKSLVLLAVAGAATLLARTASAQDIYVSDSYSGSDEITQINLTSGQSTVLISGDLDDPTGIAVNAVTGNLYIADSGNGDITEYNTTNGTFSTYYTNTGALTDPQGLAFDKNGNLFVANYDANNIMEFSSANGTLSTYASVSLPVDLVISRSGTIFATQGDGINAIAQIPSPGTSFYPTEGTDIPLSSPVGIATDSAGNLIVANSAGNTVYQITLNSVGSVAISSAAGNQLSTPEGLVFDSNGNLYVVDQGTDSVTEYASTGSGTYQLTGTYSGGLTDPTFAAITGSGTGPAVPEPGTYAMLLGGLAALYFIQRRRTAVPVKA